MAAEMHWKLRGIYRHDGAGLLEAIQEGFKQLAHRRQGLVIKPRSHPFPQHALAPELHPDRSEPGTTPLLRLVHQERQPHEPGKYHREMPLAMPIVVLKVIALGFQRIASRVCDLPPGSSSPHELLHVARAHAEVWHPTAGLDCVSASFPGLDKMDPHVRVGGIEGAVMDKAKPMDHTCGPVMSFVIGHAPGVLRCLHLLEQKGMITFFDTKNIVQPVSLQCLNVRSIRTQTVFGDNALEMGMILAPLANNPFGAFA